VRAIAAPAPSTTALEPVTFNAKMLVFEDDRQQERDCQIVLASAAIEIRSKDGSRLLQRTPYDRLQSISYSRARDPLWNTSNGAVRVVRAGGRKFGFLRGDPHWLALRIDKPKPGFVVLRLANDQQAAQAISALEQRSGRRAARVVERKAAD
jgi:hypothetical protein